MLCNIGNYLIKYQSERYIIIAFHSNLNSKKQDKKRTVAQKMFDHGYIEISK